MAAKTATVRMPIFHFIRQNRNGCVIMLIWPPRLSLYNQDAKRPSACQSGLYSATKIGKMRKCSKVPRNSQPVRLFRLMPRIINKLDASTYRVLARQHFSDADLLISDACD